MTISILTAELLGRKLDQHGLSPSFVQSYHNSAWYLVLPYWSEVYFGVDLNNLFRTVCTADDYRLPCSLEKQPIPLHVHALHFVLDQYWNLSLWNEHSVAVFYKVFQCLV